LLLIVAALAHACKATAKIKKGRVEAVPWREGTEEGMGRGCMRGCRRRAVVV